MGRRKVALTRSRSCALTLTLTLNLTRAALTLTLALALNQEPLLREGSCLREMNAVDSAFLTLTSP